MKSTIWLLLAGLIFSSHTVAREIAGIELTETIQLSAESAPLVLNGAGIRKKFFFKIYVAGLYLPQRQTTPEAILTLPGPKRVRMHFLYKEVERDKLVAGWQEGFAKNLETKEFEKLASRLTKFNQLFRTMRQDDVIDLDYLPNEGTQVWFNSELQGRIEGADFYTALLRVWLGDNPADGDLKSALLQGSREN